MKLIVKRFYHCGSVTYQPGQVLEVEDAEHAAWLMRDANGGIEPLDERPEERAPEAPPHDRMVRRGRKR